MVTTKEAMAAMQLRELCNPMDAADSPLPARSRTKPLPGFMRSPGNCYRPGNPLAPCCSQVFWRPKKNNGLTVQSS
jgi:hypothetical protein